MDVLGFFRAIQSDSISLAAGVASIVLLAVGFAGRKWAPLRLFWAVAALCFFLCSVRVFTAEHSKYGDADSGINDSSDP